MADAEVMVVVEVMAVMEAMAGEAVDMAMAGEAVVIVGEDAFLSMEAVVDFMDAANKIDTTKLIQQN